MKLSFEEATGIIAAFNYTTKITMKEKIICILNTSLSNKYKRRKIKERIRNHSNVVVVV